MFSSVVRHQKTEPPKCLQPRAASCWTGSPAIISAEAPQYCHLQGVMGGRGWSAIHRHGLLWRRWSVPKAQGAERAASAWESGGGVVCSDRYGSAGTVQTHSIPLAPREWGNGRRILGKNFPKYVHAKNVIFWKSIYEVDPVAHVLALECFWMGDIHIEVDMNFMSNWRGSQCLSPFIIYRKVHFKDPELAKRKEQPCLLSASQLCH